MKQTRFEILRDYEAYLIWYVYNDCQVKLETYYAIFQNLEVIISDSNELLAYRYDHPQNMVNMVKDDGKWIFTNEYYLIQPVDQLRIKTFCRDYSMN